MRSRFSGPVADLGNTGISSCILVPAFSPLSLNPYLWIDATKLTGFSDGQQIDSFTESSSNAYTVSQTVTSQRPIYIAHAQNGLPAIFFDGVDDFLKVGALRVPATNASYFFVIQSYVNDFYYSLLVQTGASSARRMFSAISGGFNANPGAFAHIYNTFSDPSGDTGSQVPTSDFFQVSITEDSSVPIINTWLNGAVGTGHFSSTPVAIDTAASDMIIGTNFNLAEFFWNGAIGEIVICPAVDDSIRVKMQAYFGFKWGIPIS